jgi:hypothetical protein
VRSSLADGDRTAFEIVGYLIGPENLDSPISAWALQIVFASLDHLVLRGEVTRVEETHPHRWRLTRRPGT